METPVPLTNEQKHLLKHVHIVLVEPEEPANIGAVARAIKNTGLKHLTLVQKSKEIPQAAYWVAHASEEILQEAAIVPDLKSALAPMHLVVGTTQRKRAPYFPLIAPEEAIAQLLPVAAQHPVAIVFGRESRGLDNEELYLCNIWSRIPSPVTRPAFNLAQSVLIYAYTLYRRITEQPTYQKLSLASHGEYEAFYQRLQETLVQIKFDPKDGMPRFMARVRRAFNRFPLESRDLSVLLKTLDLFLAKIKK